MPNENTRIEEPSFSLVHGGPFYGIRRALGLVPEQGLGLARRVLAVIAITWVPVVVGAVLEGRVFEGQTADPLLRHFGLHIRFLVALPLLLFAEAGVEKVLPALVRHFKSAGLVAPEDHAAFAAILRRAEAMRDSVWGTVFVVACIAATAILSASAAGQDELAWAATRTSGGEEISFSGKWMLFVARPIFSGSLALWGWRVGVAWLLMRSIAKMDLRLVPSHPDRAAGLGFLEAGMVPFAPIVFAISAVIAGRWAHELIYHGVHIDSIKPQMITFMALVLILFLGPMALLAGKLGPCKRASLLAYGDLLSRHGQMVHRRWIRKEEVEDNPLLDAPEIGPVADINAIYDAVTAIRLVPIGVRSLGPLAVAAGLPMLAVFTIEVPFKEILQKLAGALI